MKTIDIPAIEIRQNGTRLFLSSLKAGQLRHFTKVDPFDAKKPFDHKDQGYQRPPEQARIRKLGNWLKKEFENGGQVMMPTAILLSGRDANLRRNPDGTITLRESTKLPIVDGQHRQRGFDYAIYDKAVAGLEDFEVPIVILADIDKMTEMRQFRIVNGEAKSVRTDLVNMILSQIHGIEGEEGIEDKDAWKVVVSHVVKRLNDDRAGPWYDKIVMPDGHTYSKDEEDANPELRHHRIARATSFMTSLKPLENYLFDNHMGGVGSVDDRAEKLFGVVDGYWRALRTLAPACFEHADDHVMQKTPGIFALHQVCRVILPKMHGGRRDFIEPEFVAMLGDSDELTDAGYWYVGDEPGRERGEASKYGSMKGFAELAKVIVGGLEK